MLRITIAGTPKRSQTMRYSGALHFDGAGIKRLTQFRATRGTGDERIAGYDQSFANPGRGTGFRIGSARGLDGAGCPASRREQAGVSREEGRVAPARNGIAGL
jgi:hypothetical protein